jgi:hypothetical protein
MKFLKVMFLSIACLSMHHATSSSFTTSRASSPSTINLGGSTRMKDMAKEALPDYVASDVAEISDDQMNQEREFFNKRLAASERTGLEVFKNTESTDNNGIAQAIHWLQEDVRTLQKQMDYLHSQFPEIPFFKK